MERKSNKNRYQNPFHNVKYQDSKPFIETVATPVFYNGYLIYHRVQSSRADANVYDIVKDGVCVGMYAGSNGAKKAIDERALDRHK